MNVWTKFRRMQQSISVELPDGTVVKAYPNNGSLYPGISISIVHADLSEDERLCFVEMNPEKPEGYRLCIGAYNAVEDDCVYYEPYHQVKKKEAAE